MQERLANSGIPQPSSTEIISEISALSRQISSIYSLRDFYPGRYLPEEDWTEARKLHALKDQRTIDLLLQRRNNPDNSIQIVLQKYPKETIHPFSMNNVSIYVPSEKGPEESYTIKTELSDLRRPGIVGDSLEAAKLLGDVPEANETIPGFIYRTNEELVKIQKRIQLARQPAGKSKYSVDELEDLSAQLITERLLPLRSNTSFPPNSWLRFFMYEDRTGKVLSEAANLNLGGKVFQFEVSGQRLLPVVTELGGYDKIVTLIS